MKEKYNWTQILKLILDELPLEQEIVHNKNKFCFKYIGDMKTRIGYLLIWEASSKRVVQISRMGIPDNNDKF